MDLQIELDSLPASRESFLACYFGCMKAIKKTLQLKTLIALDEFMAS
jgi:hypothetical protein